MSGFETNKSHSKITLEDVPLEAQALEQKSVTRIPSSHSTVCRICQSNNLRGENLISPCNCKGSLAYVHLSCLERWLSESGRTACELCMYRYNFVQRPRYGLWESLKIWMNSPRIKAHLQSDILIALLLTVVTIGLVTVCLMGMDYFIIEGSRMGISKAWTKLGLFIFLVFVILGYFSTLYLLIKDQVTPWYEWRKRTTTVRVLLTPAVMYHSVTVTSH